MMRIGRLSLIMLLLYSTYATADEAQDADEQRKAALIEQTKAEARAILATVLRDDEIAFTPCRFDVEWLREPVSADIAQSYLGSSLKADVIASPLGVSPSDLIDGEGAKRSSFCAENEAAALWRQMKDDFRSGANPGEPDLYMGKPNGPPRIRLRRTKIAFPVFDKIFTTAVLVNSSIGKMMWKIDAEKARSQPQMLGEASILVREWPEEAGYTYVYRKQDGHWTRIHTNEDWTANLVSIASTKLGL